MIAIVMFNTGRIINIEFDAWNKAPITAVLEEQKNSNLIIDYAIRETVPQ
jgi:hypothetical protein